MCMNFRWRNSLLAYQPHPFTPCSLVPLQCLEHGWRVHCAELFEIGLIAGPIVARAARLNVTVLFAPESQLAAVSAPLQLAIDGKQADGSYLVGAVTVTTNTLP